MAKNTAVFGIFQSRVEAERAVEIFMADGFRAADLSVLFPQKAGTRDFAHEKHTKAPEGTAGGVTVGGAVGGTLGLLAGLGVLAIPGLGPFIAAGPIMAALAGIGVGGMVGGIVGVLVGMGVPEYEAKRYEGLVKDGGILMSVHTDNAKWAKKAKDLFEQSGATNISLTGEATTNVYRSHDPHP